MLFDLGEIERLPCPGDVSIDVGPLEGRLGRGHLERLEERGVGHPDRQRHEGPETNSQHGQRPALSPDVEQQDDCRQERDPKQQLDGWEPSMDVGVGGTLDVSVVGRGEGVLLEEVAGGLDEGEQREQDREVDLHRWPDPRDRSGASDPPVEVVEDPNGDGDDDQRDQQPADEELEKGQVEDVEAHVLVELRVGDAE